MKFLIDGSAAKISARLAQADWLIAGQLLTPLTKYKRHLPIFAVDNGAFSKFDLYSFRSLLVRNFQHAENCLFVAMPDVVGNHKATMKLWHTYKGWASEYPTLAFVAQDGFDGWPEGAGALFIGGTNRFKDSSCARAAVNEAKASGLHVHVGRVNTIKRYQLFAALGADTCDGSGVSIHDHVLPQLVKDLGERYARYDH